MQSAEGEYICLLNNDIEIITADWIEEMLSFSIQPGIGAVGARLWYPDGGLQHAGVILGLIGIAMFTGRLRRANSATSPRSASSSFSRQ